jgi:hypothetical protein
VRGGKGCGRKGPIANGMDALVGDDDDDELFETSIASGMNALASGMDALVGPHASCPPLVICLSVVICLLSQGLLLLFALELLVCTQSCPHSQHAHAGTDWLTTLLRVHTDCRTHAHREPHNSLTPLMTHPISAARTAGKQRALEPKLATRNHPASSDGKPCSFNRDSIVSNQEAGSRKQEAGSRKDSREARNEKHVTRSTSREARHEKHVKDAPSIPPPHGRQECDEHKAYPHMAPRMR